MQFPKLAAPTVLALALAACGGDGPRWHDSVEQDGHTVEFDTWYHPPGIERVNGNDGMSIRIAVDGKTATTVGNYIPPEWEKDCARALDYPQTFWAKVTTKFEGIKPPKEYKNQHAWIRNVLIDIRDVPRTLPADFVEQQALTIQKDDPAFAQGLAYSQEMGKKMMADYRKEHPEEFDADGNEAPEYWGSNIKGRKKNRGFRHQLREPGYEYHQVLQLWAEHFYITGYDHSGTKVWTYKRRMGANDPWQIVSDGRNACNHGACPGTERMAYRQTCDTGVVSDWYVEDGECDGNWMSGHLCNDDTSLQINHAQGVWTGNKCPGHNRGIVPKCGRQFK